MKDIFIKLIDFLLKCSAFLMSVKESGYNIFVVRGQYPASSKEVKNYFYILLNSIKTL